MRSSRTASKTFLGAGLMLLPACTGADQEGECKGLALLPALSMWDGRFAWAQPVGRAREAENFSGRSLPQLGVGEVGAQPQPAQHQHQHQALGDPGAVPRSTQCLDEQLIRDFIPPDSLNQKRFSMLRVGG